MVSHAKGMHDRRDIIFCRLNDSELDRKYALAGMRR